MEERKLLIVGIDPGTTTGYAVLDIDGNFISANSSKLLDLNRIISEIVNLGKVVIVGTDKFKVPGLVDAFAAKFGAKIASPKYDLTVNEKRMMTNNFSFKDDHQSDALASALFAYKETKPLLDKIDNFSEENKKQNIKNRIKELVIIKKLSIKNAVAIIEKKDEESKIIEKVIVEKKFWESDFLKLYNKLKGYEAEIKLVRKYNSKLMEKISSLEKQIKAKEAAKYSKKIPDFREKRIIFLENLLKSKENDKEYLRSLIKKYNNAISNIDSFYVLKKLSTLGANEFNFKNKILNIRKDDILLVDNPNIVSRNVVDLLKDNVFLIVYKNHINKKIEKDLPFIFINANNLKIDEDKYFGFVEKKNLEFEKSKTNWARKIIDDYKKEKEQLIG